MFLFTIRSRIKANSKAAKEFSDVGGAYVNCYVQFKDVDAAEKLARLLIRDEGWIPEVTTDSWRIQKKNLKGKRQKQYYAEALKYGYSMVFNLWRKDAPDADHDYENDKD